MLSDAEYEAFGRTAVAMLVESNDRLEEELGLSRCDRWDIQDDEGELIFSRGGARSIVARIQYVGTISLASNTWLWSWANDGISQSNSELMLRVKAFGEENGIPRLVEPQWPAREEDGWEMTAIASSILGSRGGFLGPLDDLYIYLVMQHIQKEDE
jgi:hypothetical protein